MSLHAVWIHGNSARAQWVGNNPLQQVTGGWFNGSTTSIPWSDVVGLPTGPGVTYRGADQSHGPFGSQVVPQPISLFVHFPIPTPVIVRGVRAHLIRVFVLWKADHGATLAFASAFDGPVGLNVGFSAPQSGGHDGTRGVPADLVEGMTQFTLRAPREVLFGVGVSLGFSFFANANVTFTAAGADFDVPGI
ncbi:MAG: hypothetical protein E6J90_17850 [Deltaproteobacteria bacterium]|nr:MAG: hypothetical protein E6J91_45045 [Deltaproteobacteria bacterium]TMQ19487.1 MAG: hypothetical protein E6J90_17850 [Deltaproteobacteria bacterium]